MGNGLLVESERARVFLVRWVIPSDAALTLVTCNTLLLRSGRLALSSLNTVVWPLSACVRGVYYIGFADFIWIYTMRSSSLTARDHCSPATHLNVSARRIFRHTFLLLPFATSHIDVACVYMRWSVLATCSPHFHLIVSHRHIVLHVLSLPCFSIRHSFAPQSILYSAFRLLLISLCAV